MSKNSKGEDYSEHLSVYPIIPVAIYRVPRNGQTEEFIKLKYRTTSGETAEATIEASELATLSKAKLPGFAPAATGAKNQKLGYAIALMMEEMRRAKTLQIVEGTDETGWVDGDYITADSERYAGSAPVCFSTAGDQSEWFRVAAEMVTASPLAHLALSAALGGFVRGSVFTPDCSHILNIFGERMRGKSTIARLCASIAGDPEKGQGVFFDAISTRVGTETLLAACNHSFLCLDEADEIFRSRPQPVTDLMFYCNGGGRVKGSRTGGVTSAGSWNESIIATSNQSLLTLAQGSDRDGSKAEALATRMIEVDIMDPDLHTFQNAENIQRWDATISANYGHAFPYVVQLIQQRSDEFRRIADETFASLINEYGLEDHHRHAKFLTTIYLGQELLAYLLEGYNEEIRELNDDVFKLVHARITGGETRAQKLDALRSEFLQWVADNARRFRWDEGSKAYSTDAAGHPYLDELSQDSAATSNTRAALESHTGAYGLISTERVMQHPIDFAGLIIINNNGRKALERQLPVGELINLAKAEGWLVAGEGRNDAKRYSPSMAALIGSSRALTFRF